MSEINGPLYNSVITGKLALLPPNELNALIRAGSPQANYANDPMEPSTQNVLLRVLNSIDKGRQFANTPWLGWSGIGWLGYGRPFADLENPVRHLPVFPFIFKPYTPINQNDKGLWSESGPPWKTGLPVLLQGSLNLPDGTPVPAARLLLRKASDATGPWTVVGETDANGKLDKMLLLEGNVEYLYRPVHSRFNFTRSSVGSEMITPHYANLLFLWGSPNVTRVPTTVAAAPKGIAVTSFDPPSGQSTSPDPPDPADETREIYIVHRTRGPANDQVFAVEGNDIGLPSSFKLSMENYAADVTYSRRDASGLSTRKGPADLWMTSMTGKLVVSGEDMFVMPSIMPSRPVEIDFVVDMNGVARWGCRNLRDAAAAPAEVTVNVGSHPGILMLRLLHSFSDQELAGARIAYAYRKVGEAVGRLTTAQSNTPQVQAVRQALNNLPNTIGNAAAAQQDLQTAITNITDAQVKGQLQQAFDSALRDFPVATWASDFPGMGIPGYDFWVQPRIVGPDTDATPPSFVAPRIPQPPTQPPTAPTQPPVGPLQPPGPIQPPGTVPAPPGPLQPPPGPIQLPPGPLQPPGPIQPPTGLPPGPIIRPPTLENLTATVPLGETEPLDFTLKTAEYSVSRLRIGDYMYVPTAEQKLLVLHYSLQNSLTSEVYVDSETLTFMAVDAFEVGRDYVRDVGIEGYGGSMGGYAMAAGEEVLLFTAILLPEKGDVRELVVRHADGGELRVDLGGKVSPLPPPFADPADASGASALTEVPAQMGVSYPSGLFDFVVDGAEYSQGPIQGEPPQEGMRFLLLTLRFNNQTPFDTYLSSDELALSLRAADGEMIAWNSQLLGRSSDETLAGMVGPGQQVHRRVYFEVPTDAQVNSFVIREGEEGRTYLVDVSKVQ